MQIRTKLTLIFSVIVTVIIGIFFSLIYFSSSVYREREYRERLKAKTLSITDYVLTDGSIDTGMIKIIAKSQRDNLISEHLLIFDQNRKLIHSIKNFGKLKIPSGFFSLLEKKSFAEGVQDKYEMYGSFIKKNHKGYYIICGAWDKWGYSKLNNLQSTILILYLFTITVVLLAGYLFAGRALSPISQVIEQVNTITVDKISQRIHTNNPNDEIGRLIITCNGMLDRIEESIKMQRVFIASASHELQNPLAAITSQIEVSLMKKREADEYVEVLNSLHEDIHDLNKVTLQLLQLTRLNRSDDKTEFTIFRIDELFWSTIEYYRLKYPAYNLKVVIEELPSDESRLLIFGNEALIKTAIYNLLDNACKFSKRKEIAVVFSSKQLISIAITNDGCTMDNEDREMVFAPFFRGTKTKQIRGHGIGLSLVKKICDIHGIIVNYQTPGNSSTRVKLEFPIYSESQV